MPSAEVCVCVWVSICLERYSPDGTSSSNHHYMPAPVSERFHQVHFHDVSESLAHISDHESHRLNVVSLPRTSLLNN